MKIRTWIKYAEPYLPTPRHKKLSYREKSEYVGMELEEASETCLRPAFEAEVMVYSYGEKLWRKADARDIHVPSKSKPMTALQALSDVQETCSRYFGFNESREQVIKRASQDLKRYLLVGTDLYVQTSEPMYHVCTFGLGHNHGGTGFFIAWAYNPNLSWRSYFNALDYEKAMDYAIQTAKGRGDTDSAAQFEKERKEEYGKIKVFDKMLVTRKPQVEHGDGEPFLNELEDIVKSSDDCMVAAALCIATVAGKY